MAARRWRLRIRVQDPSEGFDYTAYGRRLNPMSNITALSALTACTLALAGCRPAILDSTITPQSPISAPEVPSAYPTHAPTPSPEPTSAQVGGDELAAEGPWLVGSGEGGIVVLNTEDAGRIALQGPPLWALERDIAAGDGVSPSGWIAARTGMPNDWNTGEHFVSPEAVPPAEVGIAIWKLPGKEPLRLIPRYSDELAAGMNEIRDFELPYDWQATGPRWKHDMVFLALLHPAARLFWSPDGRYLAFAAALDGPSADVYVYDTLTDEIRRLTDGPNQAILLGWSPDSQWILHYEATEYAVSHGDITGFPAEVLWAVSVDGSRVHGLGEGQGIPRISGWLSPSTVVLMGTASSALPHRLWSIDIDTGIRVERQDFSYYSVAVDSVSDTIAVNADALIDTDSFYDEGGVFVLKPDEAVPRRVGSDGYLCYACPIEWSEPLGLFIMYSPSFIEIPSAPVGFLPSGEILRQYEEEVSMPVVSPDGNWVAFSGAGIRIYDSRGIKITVPAAAVRELLWSADSAGLFYLEEQAEGLALMLVSVPQGTTTVVHPDITLDGLHLTQDEAAD